jgi:hypothetical protein
MRYISRIILGYFYFTEVSYFGYGIDYWKRRKTQAFNHESNRILTRVTVPE